MIKMHPLYSSSSGNMFHIETDKTDILIDIGVSYKAIIQGLKSINISISHCKEYAIAMVIVQAD